MKVLGIMSGTSTDGADLVLAELLGEPESLSWQVLAHASVPYPKYLRERVLSALYGEVETRGVALLHHELGRFFATSAAAFAGRAELAAVHGQTIWHEPPLATLQLGEAGYLAETLGVPVVSDFRPADLALGGQAAPLVAYPDLLLYGQDGVRRAIHNLGGISNLTYLSGRDPAEVLAFDTGPGNCLLDEAAALFGSARDEGGDLAASGQVDPALLAAWLTHSYFKRSLPKTTGREVWRLDGLEGWQELGPADLLATLTTFTAQSIALAYHKFVLPRGLDEVWVAGGGVYNRTLMREIKAALAVPVFNFEERGLNSKAREALAFAVLGYLRRREHFNVLGQVTGARGQAIAGKISLPGVQNGA